jgi:uncharacterized protein (TIGR03437 family)
MFGGILRPVRYACFALVGTLRALTFSNTPMVGYITYLPGFGTNYSAVDQAGYLYFPGVTGSPCNLPASSPHTADSVYGSITKLQPRGDGAVWTACLPGAVGGLALDAAGSIYIANNGNGASTVTKLAPDASKILYSPSIPAAVSSSLAVDRAGNVYVTGSAGPGLPITPGAYEPNLNCGVTGSTCTGGFVVKLGQTGAIQYATYYDYSANAIAVDSHGDVWITGTIQTDLGSVCFVVKLDSSGQRLFQKRFGGGVLLYRTPTYGEGLGIAVDANDAAYAVGYGTVGANLPTTPGTIQSGGPYLWEEDGYIVKFDALGNVIYGANLGYGRIHAVAVDAAGNAYLGLVAGGITAQVPSNCGGYVGTSLEILNADASRVLASWAVAGEVIAISQDEKGGVYVSGSTGTTAFLATPGAYLKQYPFGAEGSGFAAKFDTSQPVGPSLNCLVNAASWWAGRDKFGFDGSVAPGELVTLFGRGFQHGSDLSVTFDGEPAPVLYADPVQINAVVPFKTGQSGPFTLVSVSSGSQVIGPYQLPVTAAVPGIFGTVIGTFKVAMTGVEQAAALNEDGSINSSSNPASPGSVVSLFTTGAGVYSQQIGDGALGPMQPPFPAPVLGVGALILSPSTLLPGKPTQVLFAGQAPGLIAGVVQVNLRIPVDAPPGVTGVAVSFGDFQSTYPSIFVGSR